MSSLKSLPILRNQAPGFFRYALGNLVVTALYDGYVTLDPMSLSGITDENVNPIWQGNYCQPAVRWIPQ